MRNAGVVGDAASLCEYRRYMLVEHAMILDVCVLQMQMRKEPKEHKLDKFVLRVVLAVNVLRPKGCESKKGGAKAQLDDGTCRYLTQASSPWRYS